jgi:hypothetical protein
MMEILITRPRVTLDNFGMWCVERHGLPIYWGFSSWRSAVDHALSLCPPKPVYVLDDDDDCSEGAS